MNPLEENKDVISVLCQKHHVATLFAFGSVLGPDFGYQSDIDLVVDFKNVSLERYADNYFDLKFSLESLLHKEVDLLELQAIRNTYLLASINQTKKLVYAA